MATTKKKSVAELEAEGGGRMCNMRNHLCSDKKTKKLERNNNHV